MMSSEAKIRQSREVFTWIEDEALGTIPADRIVLKFPEYLPPIVVEEGARQFVRRAGSALKQLVGSQDRLLATGYYEDHLDPAGCCVALLIEVQRAVGEAELEVEHEWMDEVGAVIEKLLTHSVQLTLHGESRSLTFVFRLPVYAGRTIAPQPDTILLVEDDVIVRCVTREVLETGGHRVLEAQDAETALRMFGRNRRAIGLVISDVTLPGRSGIELASRLRGSAPGTPILLMSGYSTPVRENAARNLFFLEKPYNSEVLMRAVTRCLQPSAVASEAWRSSKMLTESC
jgi:CheY-like chemotaxis protein